jgi:hypothetical protein
MRAHLGTVTPVSRVLAPWQGWVSPKESQRPLNQRPFPFPHHPHHARQHKRENARETRSSHAHQRMHGGRPDMVRSPAQMSELGRTGNL